MDPNDPTGKHVLQITKELWSAAEEMAGRKFDEFVAVSYRSQVVAGVNYFIKVRTSYSHKLYNIIVIVVNSIAHMPRLHIKISSQL